MTMASESSYVIYGMRESGNCYKLKLLMRHLNIAYQWREIDIFKGESQTEEYRAKNSVGEVPLLQFPDGSYLAQSNAILFYLAQGSSYYFDDKRLAAEILQWMFFEQYSHEPYIAVARKIKKLLPADHPDNQKMPELEKRGYHALTIMQQHLSKHEYFVADKYSIADISLYAYTHIAEEGGFELDAYPSILRWMDDIRAQVGYVAMYE